jgi:hypothetical protein
MPAATLVFSTLRVGFSDAEVTVWGNGLDKASEQVLRSAAESVGGKFINLSATAHDIWIENLVNRMFEPFWIVDTDVVFFGPMTAGAGVLAGRFEPEFMEEWTGTRHVERLHTAVMRIDPEGLRMASREWMARFPAPWRNSAEFTWIRQTFVPVSHQEPLFYDTMAGAYHALMRMGGMRLARGFTDEEDSAFEHLHCGGYVDLVAAETKSGFGNSLQAFHRRVFQNPEAAHGARLKQAEYYNSRKGK